MAKTVTVSRSPNDNNIGVRIDNQVLTFTANGQATLDVEPGPHVLNFFMILPPGTEVVLAIPSPPEAKWSLTQQVPDDGVIGGFHKFVVS